MGKENPEPAKNPEKPEEKGVLLDNDTLRKLHRQEIDFDALTPEQKTEFHTRFVEGEEEGVPTEEEEAEAAKKAAEEAAKNPPELPADPPKEGDPPPIPPTGPVKPEKDKDEGDPELKRKLKEAKDRANTLQQKYDSVTRRLDNLEKMRVPEPPKIEDELDENASKQDKFNREMANKVNSWVEAESAALRNEREQLHESTMYSSIGRLQIENPELSTSKPVEVLDKAFCRFRDNLAGQSASSEQKSRAVQDFFTNPEARKAKEAQGIVFPIEEKDWANYQTISRILAFKRNGGDPNHNSEKSGDKYPDYESAYFMFKKKTGYVPDPVRQAALEAQQRAMDQVADNQNKPQLLSPGDGKSSDGVDGMTAEQAEQWLIDHPTASTPEEKAMLNAIMKKFSPASATPGAPIPKMEQKVVF